MRVLFVGDIHNHMYIFDDVERLDKEFNFDRIIFLGDYVDDWDTDNHQSLETLNKIFSLKETSPDKYTFLIGNHELSYLGYKCSGHMEELEDIMRQKLTENINKLDFFTTVQCGEIEYVCTHAGLNNGYINMFLGGRDIWKDTMELMNKSKMNNLEMLAMCSYMRGGKDEFSSFLWTDKREHSIFAEPKIIKHQIVGHTPVPQIQLIDGIFYCDTHSTYRDGTTYGDKTYLIWDERGFIIER